MIYICLYLNTTLIRRTVSNGSCMTSLAWTNWRQWQSSFGINASLETVDHTIFLGRWRNASALKRVCLVFNMVNLTFRDTWGAVRSDLRRLTHGLELIATVGAQCGVRTLLWNGAVIAGKHSRTLSQSSAETLMHVLNIETWKQSRATDDYSWGQLWPWPRRMKIKWDTEYYLGKHVKDMVDRTCSTYGLYRNASRISFEISADVGLDVKTLRWILNTSGLYERRAIPCLTETPLASLLHDISCYQHIR